MADLNEVRLIGRLTRDPVLKMLPGGASLTSFGLATGRRFKDQAGALREETTFIDITCWGKTAELVAKFMRKGRLIFIGGRLKLETWDDKQTGQKRSKLSVVAENVQFLDSKREDSTPQNVGYNQPYPEPEAFHAPGNFQESRERELEPREPGMDEETNGEIPMPPTPPSGWLEKPLDETPPF